jgi:hypothetical protein
MKEDLTTDVKSYVYQRKTLKERNRHINEHLLKLTYKIQVGKKKKIFIKLKDSAERKKVLIEISPGFNYDMDFSGYYERNSIRNTFMLCEDSFSECINQAT